MKLSASMVTINYNGEIREVKTSKALEKLGKEVPGKEWVTYAHYKENKSNSFSQIAFKISDYNEDENLIENIQMYIQDKSQRKNKEPLLYDEKTRFWYEKKSNDNKVLSVIKAGTFNVVVQSKKDGKIIHTSPNINILPSAISYNDYQAMLDELQSMSKSLIEDENSVISGESKENIEEIIDILKKLYIFLKRIDVDTKVSLEMTYKKQNYTSIKKFCSKTIKEMIVKPHLNKFSAPVYVETYNIIENQMIKYELQKLELALKKQYDLTKKEQIEIEKDLNKVTQFTENVKLSSEQNMEENLKSRKNYLFDKVEEKKQKLEIIESCENQLKEIQKIKFIKNTKLKKIKLRQTQIFANDKNYIVVWKLLKKIDYKNLFDEKLIKLNYTMIRDTWNIYEYWCLFKMIYLLINNQKWRLKDHKSVKDALDMYLNFKSERLENFSVEMEHDYIDEKSEDIGPINKVLKLEIVFNEETATNLEPNADTNIGMFKKPDYKFIFTKDNKKYYVYLDAKYRNYQMQEKEIWDEYEEIRIIEDMWEKDIVEVAIDKYIKSFEGTDHEATASFIVHCDASKEEYIDYGAFKNERISSKICDEEYKIPKHRYGSIVLLPGQETSFLLLMRMIEEYHLEIYNVCWKCGEVNKVERKEYPTSGGYTKFYYTCENCKEFWVKTHCSRRYCNHTIIKHIENYHREVGNNPWFVSCPNCNG